MSLTKIEASRNFANKLWNAARYVVVTCPSGNPAIWPAPAVAFRPRARARADRWIVSRLNTVGETQRLLESYQLGEAARNLHGFIWSEYCDWYIEIAKVQLREAEKAKGRQGDGRREERRTLLRERQGEGSNGISQASLIPTLSHCGGRGEGRRTQDAGLSGYHPADVGSACWSGR